MAYETAPKGRLIAVEGTRGPEVRGAAKRLLRQLTRGEKAGGVSEWDASNIFSDLKANDPAVPGPSPRTLALLYASDLAFRLHWEIKPALEEGRCVVAAPYVETAIALGKAVGLSRRWLVNLFRFAPRPDGCYRLRERRESAGYLGRPSDGFLEFCCAALGRGGHSREFQRLFRRARAPQRLPADSRNQVIMA